MLLTFFPDAFILGLQETMDLNVRYPFDSYSSKVKGLIIASNAYNPSTLGSYFQSTVWKNTFPISVGGPIGALISSYMKKSASMCDDQDFTCE